MVETEGGKVGFGFKKKKKREIVGNAITGGRTGSNNETKKDFITGIDGGNVQSVNPSVAKGPLVIPLKDSGWSIKKFAQTGGRPPSATGVEGNNQATTADNTATTTSTMGIDTSTGGTQGDRGSLQDQAILALQREARGEVQGDSTLVIPLGEKAGEGSTFVDEAEKLKRDVESRAEEATQEDYNRVPIADFGAAMLRGMGWSDGQGLSKDGSNTQAIEYVKRPERLGLGAKAKQSVAPQKKYIKPGESREPKPVLEVATNPDGTRKHYRTLDEKLVKAQPTELGPDVLVRINAGTHKGLLARVVQCDHEAAMVRLLLNGEQIPISNRMLFIENERVLKESMKSVKEGGDSKGKGKERADDNDRSSKRERDRDTGTGARERKRHRSSRSEDPRKCWLLPDLRVRILSKSLHQGKYYNKKGVIVDMATPTTCTVRVDDDGRVLEGLTTSRLETIVPRTGGAVMIVRGERKGGKGKILEKSNSKEVAVVQLEPEYEVLSLPFDDICATAGGHDL